MVNGGGGELPVPAPVLSFSAAPDVFVSVPVREPCAWSVCAMGEAALAAPCCHV